MDISPQVLVGVVSGAATGLVALGGYFRTTRRNERDLDVLRRRQHRLVGRLMRVEERMHTLSLLAGLPPLPDPPEIDADQDAVIPPRRLSWWRRLLPPRGDA